MVTTSMGCHPTSRGISSNRPSWLQATLSDLEQRFQSLSLHGTDVDADGDADTDSFADRAENYYQKRPQLISLMRDLYSRYLSLADRYAQAVLKSNHQHLPRNFSNPKHQSHSRSQSQISLVPSDVDDSDTVVTDISSDAESTLSFQTTADTTRPPHRVEVVVAELVARAVENELLRHEVAALGKEAGDLSRRADLQGSLLEVLESERTVLLGENTRLGVTAAEAVDEREAATMEAAEMRRRAEELARLVVRVREEHRACALGRRIEALQTQVYGLERRNRECREAAARKEEERSGLLRGARAELEKVKAENRRLREALAEKRRERKARKGGGKKWKQRMARIIEGIVVCGGKGNDKDNPPERRRRRRGGKEEDVVIAGRTGEILV